MSKDREIGLVDEVRLQGNLPEPESESYGAFMASCFHVLEAGDEASGAIGTDRAFQIARVTSLTPMTEPTSPFHRDDALVVSVSLCDIPFGSYEFWTEDTFRSVPRLRPFTVSLTDLKSEPVCFVRTPFDYLHYQLPQVGLTEVANDLGFEQRTQFRCFLALDDPFITQLTRIVLGGALSTTGCDRLEMDRTGLLLAAHLLHDYSGIRRLPEKRRLGLAPWQKKRVTEFFHANLHREVQLAEVAALCRISASHFARSFRISYGMPVTRWVSQHKLEYALDLLRAGGKDLTSIALLCGFASQSTFTRWFTRSAGVSPGELCRTFCGGRANSSVLSALSER